MELDSIDLSFTRTILRELHLDPDHRMRSAMGLDGMYQYVYDRREIIANRVRVNEDTLRTGSQTERRSWRTSRLLVAKEMLELGLTARAVEGLFVPALHPDVFVALLAFIASRGEPQSATATNAAVRLVQTLYDQHYTGYEIRKTVGLSQPGLHALVKRHQITVREPLWKAERRQAEAEKAEARRQRQLGAGAFSVKAVGFDNPRVILEDAMGPPTGDPALILSLSAGGSVRLTRKGVAALTAHLVRFAKNGTLRYKTPTTSHTADDLLVYSHFQQRVTEARARGMELREIARAIGLGPRHRYEGKATDMKIAAFIKVLATEGASRQAIATAIGRSDAGVAYILKNRIPGLEEAIACPERRSPRPPVARDEAHAEAIHPH